MPDTCYCNCAEDESNAHAYIASHAYVLVSCAGCLSFVYILWYKHNKSCDSTCFEIKCFELDLPVLIV